MAEPKDSLHPQSVMERECACLVTAAAPCIWESTHALAAPALHMLVWDALPALGQGEHAMQAGRRNMIAHSCGRRNITATLSWRRLARRARRPWPTSSASSTGERPAHCICRWICNISQHCPARPAAAMRLRCIQDFSCRLHPTAGTANTDTQPLATA